jgi:hypothetical protein
MDQGTTSILGDYRVSTKNLEKMEAQDALSVVIVHQHSNNSICFITDGRRPPNTASSVSNTQQLVCQCSS